jgi:hypothetical protein
MPVTGAAHRPEVAPATGALTHAAAVVRSGELTESLLHRFVEPGAELVAELVGIGHTFLFELLADLRSELVSGGPMLLALFLGADWVRVARRCLGDGEAGRDQDCQTDGAGE